MSFYMLAPHNLPQTQIQLPSPELGDGRKIFGELVVKEFMGGDIRTYVRSTAKEHRTYTFILDYPKALEIKEFFKAYMQTEIRVIDHKEKVYKGHFIPNTLDITNNRRPVVSFDLELEFLAND